MPRQPDPHQLRQFIEPLKENLWRCRFCGHKCKGGITRIKAHFAGKGGFGITTCKRARQEVRLAAQEALVGEGAVELRIKPGEGSSNFAQGLHQLGSANKEDDWRGTSSAAVLNHGIISTAGASSLPFGSVPATNFPNQAPQTTIQQGHTPSLAELQLFYPANIDRGAGGGDLYTKFLQGEMPLATDPWPDCVVVPSEYARSLSIKDLCTGRYQIHNGWVVNDRVGPEALQTLNSERVGELSNRQGNFEGSSTLTQVPDHLVLARNINAQRDTSITPTAVGGSSVNMQYPPNAEVRVVNPEVQQGNRARVPDPWLGSVEVLNGYGRAQFIGGHSTGDGRYGIDGSNVVDGGVGSEALQLSEGKRVAESSNTHDQERLHPLVPASNEDAWRKTSSATSLSQSSSVIWKACASSSPSVAGAKTYQSHSAPTMTRERQPWNLYSPTNARRVDQHIEVLQGSTDENLECHVDETIVEPIGTQSLERAPQTSMKQARGKKDKELNIREELGTQTNGPIAAVESRSVATVASKATDLVGPYEDLIDILDSIPEIVEDDILYFFAISHLKEKIDNRQVFMSLKDNAKKVKYLKYELRGESSLHR